MIGFLLNKIIGTANQRAIKRVMPIVDKINALEGNISKLNDIELKNKTPLYQQKLLEASKDLKEKIFSLQMQIKQTSVDQRHNLVTDLKKTEKQLFSKREIILDEILPEVFAVVRESAKRTIGLRHHDCQLIGGYVIHKGNIAEMANGEGKTLVATLSTYLNALCGEGAHVITTNDYLAKRDSQWMGPVYEFLGLSVGVIQHDMNPTDKKNAYACDITYGTNNEFGFDYLRDNMVVSKEQMMQRGFHFSIVDEVDSILVDEARTPLIISGPAEESTEKYYQIDKIIPRLKAGSYDEETKEELGDFVIDEKSKNCYLTEQGELKSAEFLGLKSLHDIDTSEYKHHVNQALRAHNNFKRDKDYVVKDGEVLIVDDFTGRLMPGRRWSDGLHQAIEAKEGLRIERENQTLATITFQNYFKMYKKLSGMSGTVATEASEFDHIYKLDVITIPTNTPVIRKDLPDLIYKSQKEKFNALCEEIIEKHSTGMPVLVGTVSIEKSEKISSILKARNIKHNVLNAKYHESEAHIVAQAGKCNAVTIATNMAGRGTDIKLGGNAESMAEEILSQQGLELNSEEYEKRRQELLANFTKEVEAEGKRVVDLGGLCVLGTGRHESRRIDNQLRGRAGRQGTPGESKFYLSLEDDLMRIFGSDRMIGMLDKLGMEEGQAIQHKFISSAIERAQKRVEGYNFDIRKQLLEYDNVMNQQREVIYEERRRVLEGDDLKEHILNMAEEVLESKVQVYLAENVLPENWNTKGFKEWLLSSYGINASGIDYLNKKADEIKEIIFDNLRKNYDMKEAGIGRDKMRYLEKVIVLQTVDAKWKDHLFAMDDLKGGIGLRGYGQKDPLIAYKKEGFEMFSEMIESIKEEITRGVLLVRPIDDYKTKSVFTSLPQNFKHSELDQFSQKPVSRSELHQGAVNTDSVPLSDDINKPESYKRDEKKVGRNDPCPCGSGKKYKKCCGQ
ncbi:MAG: preprotein translocase subunit SecA [Candidatus Kappaea frigidicola]|nr:preprotein translocase subunit SecA [Candidatus Kappaea frigidicola]